MSERDDISNEDPTPEENEDDNSVGGNGMTISNQNCTVEELSDGNLEYPVADRIEVQPTDIFTIEDITKDSCTEQNAGEISVNGTLYEFPTELDEKNCSQFSQTYFNNFGSQEKADVCDINDDHSFFRIDDTCQNIKIFDVDCSCKDSELISTKDRFKYSELSSDEFADFEDSSASDSIETLPEQSSSTRSIKSNQGHNAAHFSGGKSRLIPVASSSSSESYIPDDRDSRGTSQKIREPSDGYFMQGHAKQIKSTSGNNSADDEMSTTAKPPAELYGESLPSTPSEKHHKLPSFNFPRDNSAEIKMVTPDKKASGLTNKSSGGMSTIVEVPEENEAPTPAQSSRNPLKMKSKSVLQNRCNVCNVRLGLCAIKCRCGGYFCAKHRYDKEHNCTYDYKAMGAEEIRKNNPKVVGEKVRKL